MPHVSVGTENSGLAEIYYDVPVPHPKRRRPHHSLYRTGQRLPP
jgi:hypothetical protein